MSSPRWILRLLLLGLGLPIAIVLLVGLAALLGRLGDGRGAHLAGGAAVAAGVFWALDLIVLLLALAARSLPREAESLFREAEEPGE